MTNQSSKKSSTKSYKDLNAIDLLPKSIEALRVNLVPHMIFYFAPIAVSMALFVIMLGALFSSSLVASPTANPSLLSLSAILSMFSFVLIAVFVNALAYAAYTYTGLQSIAGKKTDAQKALKEGAKHLLNFAVAFLLLTLVVGAGFVLFVIPGVLISIYLLPRILVLLPVMVKENLKPLDGIKRADQIVKDGGVWEIAAVYFIICMLSIVPVLGWFGAPVLTFLYSLAPYFRVVDAAPGKARL